MIFFITEYLKKNKVDKEYNNTRETIINSKKKLKNITFNKRVIINEIFYYKDRL